MGVGAGAEIRDNGLMPAGSLRSSSVKKSSGYVLWLTLSFIFVVAVIAFTLVAQATIPEGCAACGMAMLGVAPFWLFAYLCLIANVIVVAVRLVRHHGADTRALRVVSWLYGAVSLGTVVAMPAVGLLQQDF